MKIRADTMKSSRLTMSAAGTLEGQINTQASRNQTAGSMSLNNQTRTVFTCFQSAFIHSQQIVSKPSLAFLYVE